MEFCNHAEGGVHVPYHGSLQESTLGYCLHALTDFNNPQLRMSLWKTAEMRAKSCHMPATSTLESNATSGDRTWTVFVRQCPLHAMLAAAQALIGGQSRRPGHLAAFLAR